MSNKDLTLRTLFQTETIVTLPQRLKFNQQIESHLPYRGESDVIWNETLDYWYSTEDKIESDRLLVSDFGAVIGNNPYMTSLDVLTRIRSQGSVTNYSTTNNYTQIYKWYEDNYDTKVTRIGTVIPKWNNNIQTLIDGITDKGLITIKQNATIYKSLSHHTQKFSECSPTENYYHDHIFEDHYITMQANMKICNKPWCDYIVHGTLDDKIYIERVYFNETYWLEAWSVIDNYITNILIPTIAAV